jgi:ring-1,2-phenylacetyl-CoA epoxidase subunit PaaD
VTASLKQSAGTAEATIWRALERVPDPEIPVLSIVDLGIVRGVQVGRTGEIEVRITPTYSGCPATEVIRASVRQALDRAGFPAAILREELSPAWTSDWITESGREKLRQFGIAPPQRPVTNARLLFGGSPVACPRCGSTATERVSEFGSTPCKAHYRCTACLEPFDYFKCI